MKKIIDRMSNILLVLIVLIGLIHLISALTLDRTLEYKQIELTSEKIPAAMNGYRVAFITDTHEMPEGELEGVAEELNTRQIDLLLLGGDFLASDGEPERSMDILSGVKTTDGIYGVEGNHDNYRELFATMEAHGIYPLSNSGIRIREGFFLAGVEDLWNRNPDVGKATEDANPDDFILLLAHNPDVTMQQDTTSMGLTLSGHTHGGQITFFGLWAPVLTLRTSITDYGQRFMAGWATSRDGTPVYVSRGVGTLQQVPRVFARPQVILLTLTHG